MVSEWKCRNPFSIEERHKIKEAIDLNMTYREMAKFLGRGKTSVMRECKRLGKYSEYDPEKAQQDFEMKQKLVGIKKTS